MNVGLPSQTIKAAVIRIAELERENEHLRKALKRIALYSPLYKDDKWANAIAEHALNTTKNTAGDDDIMRQHLTEGGTPT